MVDGTHTSLNHRIYIYIYCMHVVWELSTNATPTMLLTPDLAVNIEADIPTMLPSPHHALDTKADIQWCVSPQGATIGATNPADNGDNISTPTCHIFCLRSR